MKKGFTLIEILVGVAVFLLISLSAYQAYLGLFSLVNSNQYKIMALNLANERFEVIRNLSYSDVGEISGIPNGKILHVETFVRGGITFIATTTIRNVDLPFDGTIGGTPNDLSPADNKLVEVEIGCPSCKKYIPVDLTTTIAPKSLETASTNGALFIKVFDANGLPVPDASVHIVNNVINPHVTIDDVTDINGMLRIVDVPPSVQSYAITVTKNGYSSSRTYPPGDAGNPNPSQPDATVVLQQVTQVSFSIDKLSSISLSSMNSSCTPVSDMDLSMTGSKTIGTSLPKFLYNITTNASGLYNNNSIEWDSYTIKNTDTAYDIAGINPVNPISIQPNSSNNIKVIVKNKLPRSLLVTLVDSSTLLPIADADITLTTEQNHSLTKTTGRGSISQTDWSSGSGHDNYDNDAFYYIDDGGVDTVTVPGDIILKDIFGSYSPTGTLESSIIDTGSESKFHNLVWSPTDQPVNSGENSLKLQFASNKELTATTTWDFKGPDGTSGTYYTTSNQIINSINDGNRYAKYKVYLSTDSSTSTPNLSDVSIVYTSDCTPPGQVLFSGLSSGNYTLSASKSGYTTKSMSISVSSNWAEQSMTLSP